MMDELAQLRDALAGRYRIGRELGRGGMATVYRAHDVRHDRAVALKVFRPSVSAALGRERFLREITLTAGLDHPHIVPLLDSGEADGVVYYVMPCVEGESLRDRLRREPQLPLDDALAIAREVAGALHHAHELGVIHRDVKPENILLAGGHARLADFGIARASLADERGSLTEVGFVIGTRRYMSPEQAAGLPLDRRADIYSLGCVVYEMLAGQPPYPSALAETVLATNSQETVPRLQALRDGIPLEVEEAVRRTLSRAPADRYQTATQFAEALERGRSDGRRALLERRPADADSEPSHAGTTVAIKNRFGLTPSVRYAVIALVAAVLGATAFWLLARDSDAEWLAGEALPRIEESLNTADYEAAWKLAREIEKRMPDSQELARLWPRISWRVTIPSEPAGARVFRQAYGATDDSWEELGRTPLVGIRFPFGLSRIKFELEGYRPLVRALGGAHFNWTELGPGNPDALLVGPETFRLDKEDSVPRDMVRVPGWRLTEQLAANDFFLGRHEVTNAEYKVFVSGGGYQRRELWDPITIKGVRVPWEQAMKLFVDRTGRPGPGTWEAGHHRDGEDDRPVAGVSWYEASAYARSVGRELPTANHWQQALATAMFPWLLPLSNFAGQGAKSVTASRAMTHVGAFDLTGNVREWTATALGEERLILGGSWNDPYYIAGTNDTAAPPHDRAAGNGIRVAITRDDPAVAARLRAPIEVRTTASSVETQPVSDEIYAAYGRVFDYGKRPLNASIEAVDRTRLWIRERVLLDAGYGSERLPVHLYLPTSGAPPYQVVVYWPGWDTFTLNDVDEYFAKQVDFIVKNGRALAFPVYKGTFDRKLSNPRRPPFDTADYRDNAIDTVKDLRRTIDYLMTRTEIDPQAIAFFGYSWGGVNGPIAMAQEPRIKVGVIDIGLLPNMSSTPEVDPVNSLPRVHQPTLLLSGEFDAMIPVKNATRYFSLIGTTPADKRHALVIGGHFIPRDLLIRETLDWLDRFLGPARR
jgi:eukaryotic-like serine/threonine-protein kinase